MILYFDTETTGLRPGHIIQLAYILDNGNTLIAKNFYFNVPYIEPGAVRVHGITQEKLLHLSQGLVFADYIDEIKQDFEGADLWVAHNAKFDIGFLSSEFQNNFLSFNIKDTLDTMRYFTPILNLPRPYGRGIKFPTLSELCFHFDVYEHEVQRFLAENFNMDAAKSHDAAYDTASMYLAVKFAAERFAEFDKLIKNYNN